MIQAFRARNISKLNTLQEQSDILKKVNEILLEENIDNISKLCMESFHSIDIMNKGILRYADFQKCLSSISFSFSDIERFNIRKLINRDAFGRIIYENFPIILRRVRFEYLKKQLLENRVIGKYEKIVIDECHTLEEKKFVPKTLKELKNMKFKFIPTEYLQTKDLAWLLSSISHFNLSLLQTNILLSDVDMIISDDDKVDYVQYAPFFVNAMNILNSPEVLRQKKELMRTVDSTFDMSNFVRVRTIICILDPYVLCILSPLLPL